MQLEPTGSLEDRHKAPPLQDRVCTGKKKYAENSGYDDRGILDTRAMPLARGKPLTALPPLSSKGVRVRERHRTLHHLAAPVRHPASTGQLEPVAGAISTPCKWAYTGCPQGLTTRGCQVTDPLENNQWSTALSIKRADCL